MRDKVKEKVKARFKIKVKVKVNKVNIHFTVQTTFVKSSILDGVMSHLPL